MRSMRQKNLNCCRTNQKSTEKQLEKSNKWETAKIFCSSKFVVQKLRSL